MADRLLAPRLNNWGLALPNRSFALAYATGHPKGQNYRADRNQKFFHGTPRTEKCA
jgi:hypothetical protein